MSDATPDALTAIVTGAQEFLVARFHEVAVPPRPRHPRDNHERVDSFVSSTMRHIGAVRAVLAGPIRTQIPPDDVAALQQACHGLEQALWGLDARMRGSAQAPRASWARLVEAATEDLGSVLTHESAVVASLVGTLSAADASSLAEQLRVAEAHAPTRPHPHLPQQGVAGKVVRGIASHTDPIWDTMTGRITPSNRPCGAAAAEPEPTPAQPPTTAA